jgi:hypothetical protein
MHGGVHADSEVNKKTKQTRSSIEALSSSAKFD